MALDLVVAALDIDHHELALVLGAQSRAHGALVGLTAAQNPQYSWDAIAEQFDALFAGAMIG
jgi:hypothetical protein